MLLSGACAAIPGQYETRLTPGGAGATTLERKNMTRHSPCHGDKLSRPALSSEMSERRHTLWNQMFSRRLRHRRLFCKEVYRQPISIPQVNLVADLNDAVLRRC